MGREETSEFRKNRKILMEENDRCELCGSRRGLDVHHIIPCVCGRDDSIDNLIVICTACHAKLTPHNLLTKIGLKQAMDNGTKIGRTVGAKVPTKKSIECKRKISRWSKSFGGYLTDKEIIKELGIAHNTYYKYKREIQEDLQQIKIGN